MNDILDLPLLTGAIFIIAAAFMHFMPPKKINYLYGYRTASSMKNQQRWDFAQRYSTIKMFQAGVALCVLSLIGMVIPEAAEIGFVIGIILLVPACIFLFFTTERALRKKFPND